MILLVNKYMKLTLILLSSLFIYAGDLYAANTPLLQTIEQRGSQTLNGLWH